MVNEAAFARYFRCSRKHHHGTATMNRLRLFHFPASLLAIALVAACGSISNLTKETADSPARIADFTRVEVSDFTTSDHQRYENAGKQSEHAADLVEAQRVFADKIADEIRTTGAFQEVSRQPGDAPALRVTGDISRYDKGSIVARGLTGFVGRTHFDATVTVADARSGRVLTTLKIDRNSWPLPIGASLSTLQTTNFFMNEAAKKIAEELAAKKRGGAGQ
jgi:hypothetical protein